MRIYANQVIFDEVQKVPEIFDAIKLLVDQDRETPGKFVLSGSQQFELSQEISESLAGRIGKLVLLPYEYQEISETHHKQSIFMGAFPELVKKDYRLFDDWYASYLETYIEKDLRQLAKLNSLRDFQRLIRLLAANVSQQLNLSRFANDIGVDVTTIKRWISLLEASYIVFLLPPFFQNYGKRIVKSPKIYFYDTGLAAHLTGVSSTELFEKGPLYGALFENHIVSECMKRELHRKTHAMLYYLRTSHGEEVDLIIDRKQHKELIEIKTTETFKPAFTKAIEKFIEPGDKGYVLYQGQAAPHLEHIQILPYWEYFS